MQLRQDMSRFMLLLLATGLIALCASSCDSGSNGSGTPAEDTSAEDTPSPDDTEDAEGIISITGACTPYYAAGPHAGAGAEVAELAAGTEYTDPA